MTAPLNCFLNRSVSNFVPIFDPPEEAVVPWVEGLLLVSTGFVVPREELPALVVAEEETVGVVPPEIGEFTLSINK